MPATRLRIFISSVQNEFPDIRRDLKAFLMGDAFLLRFISQVFLFEELPAKDRRADQVYIEEVDRCDIYLGIFGYDYGSENESGISPTEQEYEHATKKSKTRLVYIWGADDKNRHPKMQELIKMVGKELVRRRIESFNSLASEVYASLVDYLDDTGALRIAPFDAAAAESATLKSLSRKRIDWFLETARRERNFPLKSNTTPKALLTHLNLMEKGHPTNAAILLFGSKPQSFFRPAETKSILCHGTKYKRPFASMQIYDGDLFEQADQARDFVLAKINRAIGTRANSITAPATYELPPDAIAEAIINAIAHRDYHSNASVEVRLFSDRLEVWNPGRLPGTLTIDDLFNDHPSVPNNPLIAESLYLTRYIEKAGSGTQRMIELCKEAALPEPEFEQRSGSFVITLWRDWLTDEVLAGFKLNERQVHAVAHVKRTGNINNSGYRQLTGATRKTAARDLDNLVMKNIFIRVGEKRGTQYILAKNK